MQQTLQPARPAAWLPASACSMRLGDALSTLRPRSVAIAKPDRLGDRGASSELVPAGVAACVGHTLGRSAAHGAGRRRPP
ncbi:hypothetical protein, partial [Xanthomonas graminis]|uniref:hypothetical protein n=1 Tax=Xanthomonas graminis TaxID=3390026 RepID=UPI0019554499